ncbi:MAG: redoxin domain-containing protein [Chitinophagaceae bacterium]
MKRIIGALMLVVAAVCSSSAQKTTAPYKVGDIVSDFKLKNVDGTMRGLVADAGKEKGYIVIFTCNHCPYAKAYEQRIMDLDKNFRQSGYPVVAINSNDPKEAPEDSFEKMAERAKEKNYSFPYLFDESQAIAKKFGAVRTPQVFLLNKNKQGKLETRIHRSDR